MPLAASKHIVSKLLGENILSCNRPNAACGIETEEMKAFDEARGRVATDLMPLAASKPNYDLRIHIVSRCNRPNAACGIETKRCTG